LEHQEEKTVLIFGDKMHESENATSLYEDDFTVMLNDTCGEHTIVTSIHNFIYRIEIFAKGALEDAVEKECHILNGEGDKEKLFTEVYTGEHQKFKDKYCKSSALHREVKEEVPKDNPVLYDADQIDMLAENKIQNNLDMIRNRVGEIYQNVKRVLGKKGYDHRIVLAGILLGMLVLFIFIGRILMCNEKLIEFFLDSTDKLSYYEETEPFCHKLENGCMKLTQMNLEQETLISPRECRTWCQEKFIPEEKCALFLPYFSKEEEQSIAEEFEKPLEESKVNFPVKREVSKEKYHFFPEGEIILKAQKYFELFVENHTKSRLRVVLKDLLLNENEHEEIVQFRAGVTTLSIEPGSKKRFKIYLEQTYYDQFEKGRYTGKLIFLLFSPEGKEQQIEKTFSFRVE